MRRRLRGRKLLFVDELDRPRRPSLLVPIIVTISFVLFVVTMYVNNCPEHNNYAGRCTFSSLGRLSFQPVSDNPLLGPSSTALTRMGGISSDTLARQHQIWRPFSCVWLHAGVFHLVVDLLGLLLIGIRMEQEFGCWRIGCIYFLSGIGGSLLSALFIENRVSVGSSAALFGLMGAIVSELLCNWNYYSRKRVTFGLMGGIALVNFIIGLFPHVGNFGHFGGFVFGVLLGFVLFMRPYLLGRDHEDPTAIPPPTRLSDISDAHRNHLYRLFAWAMAIVIVSVLYLILMVLAFKGVNANNSCSWCRNFNCAPSPHWNCGGEGKPRSATICQYMMSGSTLLLTCQSNQRSQQYTGSYPSFNLKQLCAELCS